MKETIWNFYTSNEEAWQAIIDACKQAKESIELEQFIFHIDDEIGKKFIEICEERAREGVKVKFLWDAAGSWRSYSQLIVDNLKNRGIELIFFKTLFPNFASMYNYRSWYLRNHRRTVVIDGNIGFTGSFCIAEPVRSWRDTSMRIEGPVVKDMQKSFERMWDRAKGKRVPRLAHGKSDHEFEYITNNPIPRNRQLYHRTVEAIRNAKKYVYITTPYFSPTHRIARVLRLAAHRGVDVRIIMPEHSDHPIVDLAARSYFNTLIKSGVKFLLYKERMVHTKTIVIDGYWSSIGTMNMDSISLVYNFEANIVTSNSKFAEELVSHFVHDTQNTEEVLMENWQRRPFIERFATSFVRLFRNFL